MSPKTLPTFFRVYPSQLDLFSSDLAETDSGGDAKCTKLFGMVDINTASEIDRVAYRVDRPYNLSGLLIFQYTSKGHDYWNKVAKGIEPLTPQDKIQLHRYAALCRRWVAWKTEKALRKVTADVSTNN